MELDPKSSCHTTASSPPAHPATMLQRATMLHRLRLQATALARAPVYLARARVIQTPARIPYAAISTSGAEPPTSDVKHLPARPHARVRRAPRG